MTQRKRVISARLAPANLPPLRTTADNFGFALRLHPRVYLEVTPTQLRLLNASMRGHTLQFLTLEAGGLAYVGIIVLTGPLFPVTVTWAEFSLMMAGFVLWMLAPFKLTLRLATLNPSRASAISLPVPVPETPCPQLRVLIDAEPGTLLLGISRHRFQHIIQRFPHLLREFHRRGSRSRAYQLATVCQSKKSSIRQKILW